MTVFTIKWKKKLTMSSKKYISMLGMARRAGRLSMGHDMALAAVKGGKAQLVIFAGVRSKLETADVPKFMKGLPITLVAASIVSLSFLGFTGLVEGLGLLG